MALIRPSKESKPMGYFYRDALVQLGRSIPSVRSVADDSYTSV
jgi:hypothetical protein